MVCQAKAWHCMEGMAEQAGEVLWGKFGHGKAGQAWYVGAMHGWYVKAEQAR